ncbi:MAG: SUMF1/EgtB/PvdO family nonheme iron enzyme [Phycisphaerae bacterium]|nr:SUMF1/EgtB/PvdO family nonheme iron enzyme [Phycisphaerae bacterium]
MRGSGLWRMGVVAVALVIASPAQAVDIETVPVAYAGNDGEPSGAGAGEYGYGPDRICGGVDYEYNIGKFEVTTSQYCEFLNAVAATDTYGLYQTIMVTHSVGCKISRGGSAGSYTYSVAQDWADRPVNCVSWGDAARFCNWLWNGQPGIVSPGVYDPVPQDENSTEDGSYYLNGATTGPALLAVVREPDATWVIPSEDEWYKAAYHKNDGVTGNYWGFPTSSDAEPNNQLVDPDPGNNATFSAYPGNYTIGSPYYRTEVGAHENSESPYGTFDQGGNVHEWNEALIGVNRGIRGGVFAANLNWLHAAARAYDYPDMEGVRYGFRVANVSGLVPFSLRVNTQPDWAEVTVEPDRRFWEPNSTVVLTAQACGEFSHWEMYDANFPGDANYVDPNHNDPNNPLVVVMDSSKVLTAVFTWPNYVLTIDKVNSLWGNVNTEPFSPSYEYPACSELILNAQPTEGKAFKHWEIYDPNFPGDANYATYDSNLTTTIVMMTDREVTAVFKCGSDAGPLLPMMLGVLGLFVLARRIR